MGCTKVFIVQERPNPSTDYFVLPQFSGDGFDVELCSFDRLPPAESLSGAIVVLVRYVPKAWRRYIEQYRSILHGLYFFMDDDVLDISSTQGMPLGYRWKLAKGAAFHKSWLLKNHAQLWVSTPYLQQKYVQHSPRLISPFPLNPLEQTVKLFYHGSITHQAEIDWLLPVVKEVLSANSAITFEIIGNAKVYQQFRSLDRVQAVNLMSWPAYRHFIQQPGRHIGLVPLVKNSFNAARSHTKFFDITTAGAIGIYARESECGRFVNHDVDGLVLPMKPELWVEKILELSEDAPRRTQMIEMAKKRVSSMLTG